MIDNHSPKIQQYLKFIIRKGASFCLCVLLEDAVESRCAWKYLKKQAFAGIGLAATLCQCRYQRFGTYIRSVCGRFGGARSSSQLRLVVSNHSFDIPIQCLVNQILDLGLQCVG